jgi:hypothetical protein
VVNNDFVDDADLALRRSIFATFARSGAPPEVEDADAVQRLAEAHVLVLDGDGAIAMAHPFAAPGGACRVDAGGRTWWGNCAWDGLGIVAALGLRDARVVAQGVEAAGGAVFHVAVPARAWWDDIAHT